MKVYLAISQVAAKLAKEGITKGRKNVQQGYQFRGIDDVYNALAPFLVEAKLCILPCVLERECVERQTKSGSAMFYVTVKVRFDFISAEDQSKHEVVTYGEAMDTADKATNKAMSAAYKYAAMQAFCIPTDGDNDADATTHEVKAETKKGLPSGPHSPADGSVDALSPADKQKARDTANSVVDLWGEDKQVAAYEQVYEADLSNEVILGVWEILRPHSAIRTALKKMHKEAQLATQA